MPIETIPESVTRFGLWRHAFRWWWVVTLAAWNAISALFMLRDNFLPADLQVRFSNARLSPYWDWHVWVAGSLLIALVAALEGCFREHRAVLQRTHAAHTEALTKLPQAHSEALDNLAAAHSQTASELAKEKGRNALPDLTVTIHNGSFRRGSGVVALRDTNGDMIDSSPLWITLILRFVNMSPQAATIVDCLLGLSSKRDPTMFGMRTPGADSIFGAVPSDLAPPPDIKAPETDLLLQQGILQTRFVRFATVQTRPTGGQFESDIGFRLIVADSFGQRYEIRKQGHYLSGAKGDILFD
jgi:hypothetical protein